jgi:hypothetical protein
MKGRTPGFPSSARRIPAVRAHFHAVRRRGAVARKTGFWLFTLALALPVAAGAQTADSRPDDEARVPNFLGATGLLLIPSAFIQRDRQFSVFVAGSTDFAGGGAVGGIGSRLEVGAAALNGENAFARRGTRFAGNAKLNLAKETLLRPAFSLGVTDAFAALNRGPSWYLVTSKSLIRYFIQALTRQRLALKLHLGYGGGLYDRELFGGAELFLPGSLSALAEVSAGKINAGGRFTRGGLRATLGLFDLARVGGGVSYTAVFR